MADRDKDAEKAIRLYEESLKYFNPLVYYESDMKKKEKLRSTVSGMYLNYVSKESWLKSNLFTQANAKIINKTHWVIIQTAG